MTKRKKKTPPRDTAPANRKQRDQFREGAYVKKEKRNPESESEYVTSDEERFATDKLAMTLAEEKVFCDQKTCNKYAVCYVHTTDPKNNDFDPSEYASCQFHAEGTKKFNGLHITEVISIEEGIKNAKETMPSVEAMEKMEEDWGTLNNTQRLISRNARRAFEASKMTREKSQPEKLEKPAQFKEVTSEEYQKEFPAIQAAKKRRVTEGTESTKYISGRDNSGKSKEKSGEDKPGKSEGKDEEENLESRKDNSGEPQGKNDKEENLKPDDTKNPESTFNITSPITLPINLDYSDDEDTQSPEGTNPFEVVNLDSESDDEMVTQEKVTQTPEKANSDEEREIDLMVTQEAETTREEKDIPENEAMEILREYRKKWNKGEPLDGSGLPTVDETENLLSQFRQWYTNNQISWDDYTLISDQMRKLKTERIKWNIQHNPNTTDTLPTVQEELQRSFKSFFTDNPDQLPRQVKNRIDEYKSELPALGQLTKQKPQASTSNIATQIKDAVNETEEDTTKIMYSKVVANLAINKEKGKDKETSEGSFDTESEDDIESDIIARTCNLVRPKKGSRTPPFSDQTNTLWWDLSKVTADHKTIARAIVKQSNVVGYSYRERSEWLEIGFIRDKHRDEALNKPVHIDSRNIIDPIAPRHILGNEIFVHLVNVPLRLEQECRDLMLPMLSTFGKIKKLEPVRYKAYGLISRRWNAIITIPWGTKLVMPSVMEIKGQRILAFWEGSQAACSTCLQEGHWQNRCNRALQKKAEDEAYFNAPVAPFLTPDKQPPTTPETSPKNASPESSGTSSSGSPPPPPPPTQPTIPETPTPTPETTSPSQPRQPAGKGPKVMASLLQDYAGDILSFAKAQGFRAPALEKKATEFTEVVSPTKAKRQKTAEKKEANKTEEAAKKAAEEAAKARAVNRREEELQGKKKQTQQKQTTAPTKAPRPVKSETQKAGQSRTRLEKDIFCYYGLKIKGFLSLKQCEKIYNMNRQQWDAHRQIIDQNQYNLAYDWGRTPRGRELNFDPKAYGIRTLPISPEDIINEPTANPSSSSSSDDKKKIRVKVDIVNPDTLERQRIYYTLPDGSSIGHLKKMIAKQFNVQEEEFRVISRGKTLRNERMGKDIKNNWTLSVLGNWEMKVIAEQAAAEAASRPEPAFKTVFVRDSEGKRSTFDVTPSTTTSDLMRMYAGRLGKTASQLIFIFNNNFLDLKSKLSESGVKHKDTIIVSPELRYVISVRAVINGPVKLKKVKVTSEMTIEIVKHDVGVMFGIPPASFELEKNGSIVKRTEKVQQRIQDGDIISVRHNGTTRWDENRKDEPTQEDGEDTIMEESDHYILIQHHDGQGIKREAYSYRWTENTTIAQIRDYLRPRVMNEKLELKLNNKQYDSNTMLKDTTADLTNRELLVEAMQEDDNLRDASQESSEDSQI
jgi:hypothetical protein